MTNIIGHEKGNASGPHLYLTTGGILTRTSTGKTTEVTGPSAAGQTLQSTAAGTLAWSKPRLAVTGPSGAIAETFPRQIGFSNSGNPLATGRLMLCMIGLQAGDVITSITFLSQTTAMSAGTNQWFGLFDSSRNLLAVTNDDTSTAWASSTAKTLNLTTPYTVTTTGAYYLGCMVKATTVPSLSCCVTSVQGGWAISPVTVGTADTGLTTPPTPGAFTATSLTVISQLPYAWVS